MALVSDVRKRVRTLLSDPQGVRWPDADYYAFIGDAERSIATLLPEATAVEAVVDCVTGQAKQVVPTPGWKVLKVVANTRNGSPDTYGDHIPLASFDLLDTMDPSWRSRAVDLTDGKAPAVADGKFYQAWAFDPLEQAAFWLFPATPANDYDVYVLYSTLPADKTAMADTLTVPDRFLSAIVDFACYRSLTKEGRFSVDPGNAQSYMDRFLQQMQLMGADIRAFVPQARKPPSGP